MNVYEVVFITRHHYGNGHMEREEDSPIRIVAKDGEDAVKKAKKKVLSDEPRLESIKRIVDDVG